MLQPTHVGKIHVLKLLGKNNNNFKKHYNDIN